MVDKMATIKENDWSSWNTIIVKSETMPNLDPGFWLPGESKDQSVSNIMSKPYLYNVWVHSCVRSIAQNVAQIERAMKNKSSSEVNPEHKVTQLLDKPNKLMDYYTFFYTVVCHLLLPCKKGDSSSGGQCFIVPWNGLKDEPARLDRGEIPDELMPFSPAFFEPWYEDARNGMRNIRGWIFKIPNMPGSAIKFEHGQLITITVPNPYDLLLGNTPFSAIAGVVETDANSDIFNNNLFMKQGHLDGVVSAKEFIPNEELSKFKEEWYKQYTGPKQNKVAFLSGGLEYEQYGLSSADLGYIDQGKWARQKILASYGVNRIAVGDYEDINLATIREGRKMLWYDRYIPLDKLIVSAFNGQWINNVDGGRYKYTSYYSKVPALQTDMRERVTVGGVMCSQMGFPPELAARILEIPIEEDDLKRWPFLSESVKPQQLQQQLPNGYASKNKSVNKDRSEYSRQYIKSVLDPVEKKFKIALEKYFIAQRNKIMDSIDEHMAGDKSVYDKAVSAWQFLPDEALETFELLKMHKEASKLQSALEKKQTENELHRQVDWDPTGTQIDYWVSVRAKYIKDINTATFSVARDAINETVRVGTEEGITVSEMRERVKRAVHDVYDTRIGKPVEPNGLFDLGGMSSSRTIARTEMGNIATLTRADIFKSEGIEKIEWVTAHDERVRDSHAALDGKQVVYGDMFSGSDLRYPRDPNGGPGEVINCRCSFVAVVE